MGQIFTVDEVAEALRVSPQSVRRYIRSGSLAAFRFGRGYRVSYAALQDFLSESSVVIQRVKEELRSGGNVAPSPGPAALDRPQRHKKNRRRR